MIKMRLQAAAEDIQEVINMIDSLAYDGAIFDNEAEKMICKLQFALTVLMEG